VARYLDKKLVSIYLNIKLDVLKALSRQFSQLRITWGRGKGRPGTARLLGRGVILPDRSLTAAAACRARAAER
jgi:hypothetical protein